MDDWKGKKVRITVYKKASDRSWSSAEPSKDYVLDADTIVDVFNEYDSSLYTFMIEPSTKEAWPAGLGRTDFALSDSRIFVRSNCGRHTAPRTSCRSHS